MANPIIDRTLVCHGCGTQYAFGPRFEPCAKCQGPLDVEIDIRTAFKQLAPETFHSSGGGIWKFAPLLPVQDKESIVTLGEGATPLFRNKPLNDLLGLPNLLIKNESINPTWSFKDRLNSVNASLAREFGYRDLVALSTGNHGASASAYASAAGIRNVILFPDGTPEVYAEMVQAYGGNAVLTEWHGRAQLLTHLVRERGWFPSKSALPTPVSNPFGLQGYKSIAYEIWADLRPRIPDYVFVPVGSGDDIYGIYKGFHELLTVGLIDRAPVLVACEPANSNPVATALNTGVAHVTKVANPATIAISISEGIASDHALRAVRGTGGFAVSPSEAEIADAMKSYAHCGLLAESSSAVPLAAAKRLVIEGRIAGDAMVVLILTSAGIKWPRQLAKLATPAVTIKSQIEALDHLLNVTNH